MAKRFFESGKFRDSWYRNLTPKEKCIWEFMLCECNAGGILDIDFKSMTFHIGVNVTKKDLQPFESRIVWIRESKVFIPKFIDFQYPGGLNPANRAHKNILPMLKQYLEFDEEQGAWKPLARALQGPKEKEQVQETEQEQVTEKETEQNDKQDKAVKAETKPVDNPDGGTFRAVLPEDAPINQRFAAWFIKTVSPEHYATCDKEDTNKWYVEHGSALSRVVKKGNKDMGFLRDITTVGMRDMAEFSRDKPIPIPLSLETMLRNWPKYLPLALKEKKKREIAEQAAEMERRESEAKRKQEQIEEKRRAAIVITRKMKQRYGSGPRIINMT
ncbi:hypothetical protein AAIR98_000098 [Elusimicrobium simillimum]|uniref:hypothetical protein n=1 Tax=Elusimicrobium simillimum TaxID=3143438 RepID=UPI003C6F94B6